MPASLLLATPSRGVARHESTRSDSSSQSSSTATAAKKVSFNRAVRVKKFPKKPQQPDDADPSESPGKRFWFRVYKNRHRQSPPRSDVIYYDSEGGGGGVSYHPNPSVINYPAFTSECGTQTNTSGRSSSALLGNEFTPLHPSQMPSGPPEVRRNYVKKIVSKFNEEAVLQRQRSTEDSPPVSPPGSPKHHSTPMHIPPPPPPPPVGSYQPPMEVPPLPQGLFTNPRPPKRAPIVNGVKVMFGEPKPSEEKTIPIRREDDDHDSFRKTRSYAVHSDGSETDVKVPYPSQDTFLFGEQDLPVVKRNGTSTTLSPARRYDDDHHENGYYYDNGEGGSNRRGKYHVDAWDSGPRLVFDEEDVNTSTGKTDKGHFMTTVGEKHQLWQNNKRVVVYEEDSPTIVRRKAKSQSDLRHLEGGKISPEEKLDKGVSTDELFIKSDKKDTLSKKQKDSWLRHFRSATKDKGIQCDKVPTDEPQELYGFGRYKIIRPRNGTVSAFSNVPKLDNKTVRTSSEQTDNGYNSKDNSVIYSQIDKSKKKRNGEVHQQKEKKKNIFSEDGKIGSLFKSRSEPLYIGPPPTKSQTQDDVDGSYYEDKGERTIKTSKKSFGFRLGRPTEPKVRGPVYEEDWYNVDGDLEAAERQKRRGKSHRDISEVRQEIAEEEISDASSLSNGHQQRNGGAGSVMREVDYKKREISYENVPRSEEADGRNGHAHPGMWYRDADEDYRREMAQSEVSYPAGNSVGSDRFYTVDRKGKKPPPSPRAYTLDRRHNSKVANTSGVKILVNGKEVKDKSSGKKSKKQQHQHREEPSSVQSDPVSVRGGLAAAYQARQRANVRRSNSSVSGMSRYGSSPNIRRIVASSDISAASSESESSRHRRPLVMYIPGVSHPEKASDGEDRVRSSVSRSQSMLAPTRPPRVSKRSSNHRHKGGSRADLYRNGTLDEEDDEIMPLASDSNRKKPPRVPYESKKQRDIKRSNSMPKDTKFSWLKWKIRGKPSREP